MTAPERHCDRSCKHWMHDMDASFCTHPKSMEIAPLWGASTNRMGREGHCMTGDHGNRPEVVLALWEPKP